MFLSGAKIISHDFYNGRLEKTNVSVKVPWKNFYQYVHVWTIPNEIQIEQPPECHPICFCPSLEVIISGGIRAGRTVIFTAQVLGGVQTSISYGHFQTVKLLKIRERQE